MKYILLAIISLGTISAVGYVYNYATVSDGVYQYVRQAKWSVPQASYYVNTSNVNGLSSASVVSDVRAAADAWKLQTGASFGFSYAGTTSKNYLSIDNQNTVFFNRNSAPWSGGIASCTWTIDFYGNIIDFDIEMFEGNNTFYSNETGGCSGGFYIQDTLTHEFGHALGLSHTTDATATMYSTANRCDTSIRTLASDDIAGDLSLYPAGASVTLPLEPTDLTVASVSYNSVSLRWTDQSNNESGFKIERSTNGIDFGVISTVGQNATSFADSNVVPETIYYYKVRAYSNTTGNSGSTNVVNLTTPTFTQAPYQATSPSPTNGSSNISEQPSLSWAMPFGATSFRVYFGTSSTTLGLVYEGATNNYQLGTLASGATYFWRVDSINNYGITTGAIWKFTTRAAKRGKVRR